MKKTLSNSVLEQIETKHITMRPRWQFTLVTLASGASALGLGLVAVYCVNVLTLVCRMQVGAGPMYGAQNRLEGLLADFPWWTLAFAAGAIGALIWLLRKSSRLYKIRTVWAVIAVVLVGIVGGVLFAYSSYGSVGYQHYRQTHMQMQQTRLQGAGRGMHRNLQ